jgi:hypothetical protein
MKRWTDGKRWGASRVGQGGFLLYAEYVLFPLDIDVANQG